MADGIKKINENVITPRRSLTITDKSLPDNDNWQVGTLKADTANAGLMYKSTTNGDFSYFDARYILLPETITTNLIMNGTILTEDLHDGCVTNDKIADRTINHIKMQFHTLTDDEMANESITTRALYRQSVVDNEDETLTKISYHTILNRSLSDKCIAYRNMQPNSVGVTQIINGSVITDKIYDRAVTGNKIAKDTIDWFNISPYTIIGGEMTEAINETGKSILVQGRIAQHTLTEYNIASNTITDRCILDGAITNRCLGDGEVYGVKIRPKSIMTNHIADRTISNEQIMVNGIYTENYRDQSVTKTKLAPDVFDIIENAVTYDAVGNVTMLQKNKTACDVYIGSKNQSGESNKNGSLTVYGDIKADRVYNMVYSDLAEGYIPGEELEPGDIVELREDGKVYKALPINIGNKIIVGVISDEYAACYGATKEELIAKEKVAVALIGRVHVKVDGPVKIGDKINISLLEKPGIAKAGISQSCIGRALETINENGIHKVLCLVRPF